MNTILSNLVQKRFSRGLLVSLVSMGIRGSGAVLVLALNALASRLLGAQGAAPFFFIVVLVSVVSFFSRQGTDNAILRFAGHASKSSNLAYCKSIFWRCGRRVFLFSLLTSVAASLAWMISNGKIFPSYIKLDYVLVFALLLPIFSLSQTLGYCLQSTHNSIKSTLVLNVVAPLFSVVFLLAYPGVNTASALMIYCFSAACAVVMAYFFLSHRLSACEGRSATAFREFDVVSRRFWVIAVMNQLVIWSAYLISSAFLSSADFSYLSAAQRLSMTISFVLVALNNMSAPKFSNLFYSKDMAGLKKEYRKSVVLSGIVAVPFFLVCFFAPETLLSMFGAGFGEAALELRILAVGQLINAITGPVGYLLNMTGHERDMRSVVLMSGALSIALALFMVPMWGASGAAIATAIGVALQNVGAAFMVRRRLGISAFVAT